MKHQIKYDTKKGRLPNCIQFGTDGFGHQLEGTFGLIAMHISNKINYVFDHKKNYKFAHPNVDENCAKYMQYAMQELSRIFPKKEELQISKTNHVHTIYKIPKDFKDDVLYSLDNAFKEPRIQLENATDILKKVFRMNPYLPRPSYSTDEKTIVIHVRLGDGTWLQKELDILYDLIRYFQINKDNNIIVHTNGDIPIDESKNLKIFDKKTHVLQVLSDFIYAQTLVLSFSALGIAASWLTDESTTIIAPSHLKDTTRFRYSKSYYDAQQKKL